MAILTSIIAGFVLFTISGLSISFAAWPRLKPGFKVATSILFGAILLLVHSFILLNTRGGISIAGLALGAILWFLIGFAANYLFNKDGRATVSGYIKGTPIARYGLKEAMILLTMLMIIVAFLLIPLTVNLSDNVLWRYRAYMIALVAVGLVGFLIRTKLRTALIGSAILVLLSLGLWMANIYPVGTPLLQASSVIREGFTAEVSMFDIEGVQMVIGMLAPFALAADVLTAIFSAILVGISAVILINTLILKGSTRTILALFLVFLLLIPGLLIPYAYTLGVGGLEFGASIGIGALEGLHMVDSVQNEDLNENLIQSLQDDLISAGESFQRSEVILTGLERLRMFGFVGSIPVVGKYSDTGRFICWGLANGANGLQTSALGIMDILRGVLTIFNGTEITEIGSFDLLGPRIIDEELDDESFSEGIMQIDSAFSQIRSGFPRIRLSLNNFSEVDPSVLGDSFPDVSDGLDDLLENTRELEIGIDLADIFFGEISNPTPATHFLLASYSIAKIAPNLTDLREPSALPSLESVIGNLTYVSMALEDPVVIGIRQEGGNAGDSITFVADAIDLIETMVDLGDKALVLANDIESMRGKFEQKSVYDYTQIELNIWKSEATELTVKAEELSSTIDLMEDKVDGMVYRSTHDEYGYANSLAEGSIEMLDEVLMFLKELKGIVGLTYGLESLVSAADSFNQVYQDMIDLERQILSNNLVSARQTAADVKREMETGRSNTEDLLDSLEEITEEIQLPIVASDIEVVVETAEDIELEIGYLQDTLRNGDKEASLDHLSDIKVLLGELSEELQIEDRFAS